MSFKVLIANIAFMLRRSRTFFASTRPDISVAPRTTPENAAAVQSLIQADLGALGGAAKQLRAGQSGSLTTVAASSVSRDEYSPAQVSRSRQNDSAVPRHVAIIMDGNNRWAKKHPMAGISGHKAGVETIRSVLDSCDHHGVDVLTLFAFSSENWARPQREVTELMSLFKEYLNTEVTELHKRGVRIRFIGRRDRLEQSLCDRMDWAEQLTYRNPGRVLVLAVDYGGRWDICQAVEAIVAEATSADGRSMDRIPEISEEAIANALQIADLPEPDLCIRTGGEYRVSNFMLWQFSYSEFYFTEKLWPDFAKEDFSQAIASYGARERRFGCTSEQVAAVQGSGRNHA